MCFWAAPPKVRSCSPALGAHSRTLACGRRAAIERAKLPPWTPLPTSNAGSSGVSMLAKTPQPNCGAEFPTVKIHIREYSVGSRTTLDGHSVSIDCVIPDASEDTSDNVALEIGIHHVHSLPEFDTADVCWGAPAGIIEADLDVLAMPYTREFIEAVETGLPRLVRALTAALSRGRPLLVRVH